MSNRRGFLAASAVLSVAPGLALARTQGDARLVVILLRGAMDGLNVIVPVGDPAYGSARGMLAINDAVRLSADFGRHPALENFGKAYAAKQALAVHAIASPYRDRSHFDAQNVMETGGLAAYALKDGWLNRALGASPGQSAVAIAQAMPAILQGRQPASSYAPSRMPDAPTDLMARISQLYAGDPLLEMRWAEALETRAVAEGMGGGMMAGGPGRGQLAPLADIAAKLLSAADGARIAVLDHGGWDTHAAQGARLTNQLRQLDAAFAALQAGLAQVWDKTVVVAITEFGRTVAANGTGGTDHGTASAALLMGGAVNGGRVIADWPGLGRSALYEGRDLRPTADLRALLKGVLADHMKLPAAALDRVVFPDSASAKAMAGLIRMA
jgi:uncharacterized protein (DUF1501 family)